MKITDETLEIGFGLTLSDLKKNLSESEHQRKNTTTASPEGGRRRTPEDRQPPAGVVDVGGFF